jgi:hypothetical protein
MWSRERNGVLVVMVMVMMMMMMVLANGRMLLWIPRLFVSFDAAARSTALSFSSLCWQGV